MRTIERTSRFKRDFRHELQGGYRQTLVTEFTEVLHLLGSDAPLPSRFRDHALGGQWADHRDLHLRPDLVLIYRKPSSATLQLVRLGSHSELEL